MHIYDDYGNQFVIIYKHVYIDWSTCLSLYGYQYNFIHNDLYIRKCTSGVLWGLCFYNICCGCGFGGGHITLLCAHRYPPVRHLKVWDTEILTFLCTYLHVHFCVCPLGELHPATPHTRVMSHKTTALYCYGPRLLYEQDFCQQGVLQHWLHLQKPLL